MALRKILQQDNEMLRKVCKPVTEFNERLWQLLDDMKDTMLKNDGVGLAAPQVGIIKRVVVIEVNEMYMELINPEIIDEEGNQYNVEGCLSVSGVSGYCNRPLNITVRALDRFGTPFTISGTNLLAVCLSHEIDHLNGVLFTDKMVEEYKPNSKQKRTESL